MSRRISAASPNIHFLLGRQITSATPSAGINVLSNYTRNEVWVVYVEFRQEDAWYELQKFNGVTCSGCVEAVQSMAIVLQPQFQLVMKNAIKLEIKSRFARPSDSGFRVRCIHGNETGAFVRVQFHGQHRLNAIFTSGPGTAASLIAVEGYDSTVMGGMVAKEVFFIVGYFDEPEVVTFSI